MDQYTDRVEAQPWDLLLQVGRCEHCRHLELQGQGWAGGSALLGREPVSNLNK